jgi:hypothetical protein
MVGLLNDKVNLTPLEQAIKKQKLIENCYGFLTSCPTWE